ncbi:hypothetical protein ILYODFUR_017242 [Ilyodon furcidens]|uniref:Uncharacterized protein n=1 Tax=Ilyodon furcidens TaxID=33524 RepID=A0ABV0V5E7_9TELE
MPQEQHGHPPIGAGGTKWKFPAAFRGMLEQKYSRIFVGLCWKPTWAWSLLLGMLLRSNRDMGRNYGPEHITSHSSVLNANREIFDKADRQFSHRLLNKSPLSRRLGIAGSLQVELKCQHQ